LFAQTLTIAPHLSSSGIFGMVYEHLLGFSILKDPSFWLFKLFSVVNIIACGDIPRLVASMLGVNRLLAMAKNIIGFYFIVVGEVFLQLINRSIILQLWKLFQKHLGPHQFGISTLGGCEAIHFFIPTLIDLHLDWVVM
jgi:hypothetical protein